jgi:hypothetical protein
MAITIDGTGSISGLSATGISAQPVFAGNILQVVQGSTTTSTAITSTSYTDSTLSASITPSSSSSKVLILVSHSGMVYSNQTATRTGSIQLVRDSTAIHEVIQALGVRGGLSTGGDISNSGSISITYLDSPATTSSITYKTQGKISNADSNYTLQISNSASTITLLEVAA